MLFAVCKAVGTEYQELRIRIRTPAPAAVEALLPLSNGSDIDGDGWAEVVVLHSNYYLSLLTTASGLYWTVQLPRTPDLLLYLPPYIVAVLPPEVGGSDLNLSAFSAGSGAMDWSLRLPGALAVTAYLLVADVLLLGLYNGSIVAVAADGSSHSISYNQTTLGICYALLPHPQDTSSAIVVFSDGAIGVLHISPGPQIEWSAPPTPIVSGTVVGAAVAESTFLITTPPISLIVVKDQSFVNATELPWAPLHVVPLKSAVAMSGPEGGILAYSDSLSLLWRIYTSPLSMLFSLSDVSGDNFSDLIAVDASEVLCIDGATGYTLWSLPLNVSLAAVGNLNADPYPEFASITKEGYLYIASCEGIPPKLTILEPTGELAINVSDVHLHWTAEGADQILILLDGENVTETPLPGNATSYTVSNITSGMHTIEVRAIDEFGNTASCTIRILIDTIPPSITITQPVSGFEFPFDKVPFSFTISDPGGSGIALIEVRLDRVLDPEIEDSTLRYTQAEPLYGWRVIWSGEEKQPDEYVFENVPNGVYIVYVRARDGAGNVAIGSCWVRVRSGAVLWWITYLFYGVIAVALAFLGLRIWAEIRIRRRIPI